MGRISLLWVAIAVTLTATVTGTANGLDPDAGRQKATVCVSCHYPGHPYVVKIGGQPLEYLRSATRAYRDGTRKSPIMEAYTRALSDEDIDQISTYFASLGCKEDPFRLKARLKNDAPEAEGEHVRPK